MRSIRPLMISAILAFLGCTKHHESTASDIPDFVPVSPKVFEYQRRELARIAFEFGRTPNEILSKEAAKGRAAVFDALQVICSWKYINQRPMSQIERFTLSIQGLSMEVINGGFHQYFSNSTGDDWDVIVWGLTEANDTDGLERFREILAVFPNGRPSRNRSTRNRQLDSLGDAQWTAFDSFDKRFYEKQFPDWEKAWALIVRQASQIHPEWPGEAGSER